MLVTPPVVKDCIQQYKTPTPTPALTPNTTQNDSGAQDQIKISNAIEILEKVKRVHFEDLDEQVINRVIAQLNTDLMYLKLKHGK